MDSISALSGSFSPDLRNFALPQASVQGLKGVPYQELGNLGSLPAPGAPLMAAPTGGSGGTFDNILGRLVHEVSGKQAAASSAVAGLLSGEKIPLHRAMLASEEASLSFHLMVEVRNKLLDAYHELMRMQV